MANPAHVNTCTAAAWYGGEVLNHGEGVRHAAYHEQGVDAKKQQDESV